MVNQNNELARLKTLLQDGLAQSQQGSYERRLPTPSVQLILRTALAGLRQLVTTEPSAEVWRALALAEESLLHYPAAVAALKQAIALSPQADRKDLKRLALLMEYATKWERLGLTPVRLTELGRFLETSLQQGSCDHTHKHTGIWLKANKISPATKAIAAMKFAGGHCDCEVLTNVV